MGKRFGTGIIFLIWMIFTMILIFSLVGLLLIIPSEAQPRTTWMAIGMGLKDKFLE